MGAVEMFDAVDEGSVEGIGREEGGSEEAGDDQAKFGHGIFISLDLK
jgi:hypothetical protein